MFEQDHNLGLVSLVDESLRRRIIQKLTQTWSTLSLGQLTNLLGMDSSNDLQVEEVEREVMGMVCLLSFTTFLTKKERSSKS